MKQGYTDITIVLDRSGSMSGSESDVIGGFNQLVADQKKGEGTATLTLIQFDNKYEVNYTAKDIQEVEDLTGDTYRPRGTTALHDAFGKTINTTGERLANMPESERPEKVLFVVQTDGMENASKEYSLEKVKEMVTHQSDKYNWEFMFLGADIDAIGVGRSLGIDYGKTIQFSKGKYMDTMNIVSSSMSSYRSAGSGNAGDALNFTDEDRATAMSDETI